MTNEVATDAVSVPSPATIDRRLRVAMVGGGLNSFIGETHRVAMRADGLWDLTAGFFSRNPDTSQATADPLLIDPERSYASLEELLVGERARPDGVDAVVVATPPDNHLDSARAVLEAGFHLVLEKPTTSNLDEAVTLLKVAEASGRHVVVCHCYSGFPLVRQAREMVRSGQLGRITMVDAQFAGGGEGLALEPADPAHRTWRLDGSQMGENAILGEITTHTVHLAEYVSGQHIARTLARMDTLADRRIVRDNLHAMVDFNGGAVGRLWNSYVATGANHGLKIWVYGTDASLFWDQEAPEVMEVRHVDGRQTTLVRGGHSANVDHLASTRFSAGHSEGYGLAYANLYREFARGLIAELAGHDPAPWFGRLPSLEDGVRTMAVCDAITESSVNQTWVDVPGIEGK
jgi:predicted dehydrogenase